MKLTINRVWTFLYFIIIIVFFFISFNEKKDDKIHLGGDNIAYYFLGKAIVNGEGYVNNHTVKFDENGNKKIAYHKHYPPGYPFVMATFMSVFGTEVAIAKNINGFLLMLSAILLFSILKKIKFNIHLAFVATLFMLHNYHILYFSMYMYSEISFMFFLFLFFYAYLLSLEKDAFWKTPYFYIAVFSMVSLFYIKTMAIGILGGFTIYLLINKKWKEAIGYNSLTLLFYAPWMIRMSNLGGGSYTSQLLAKNPYRMEMGKMEFLDWFTRFGINFKRYLSVEIPDGIIPMNPIYNYKNDVELLNWVIGVVLVAFIVFGLIKLKKHSLFLFLSLAGLFGILLFWPEVWFGKRFITPILPILTSLFLFGIYALVELLLKKMKFKNEKTISNLLPFSFLLFFIFSNQSNAYLTYTANGEFAPKYSNYFKAAKWIKNNTSDTSITACRKPNLFHVYSEKYVTQYKKDTLTENVLAQLDKRKVTHVIVESLGFSSTGKYLVPTIRKHQGKFKQVFKLTKPDTYILEYTPNLGYDGQWEGNKKEGQGTFKYQDGSIYVGEWKNNTRTGFGKYTWKNNMEYTGIWKNNMRDGKGKLKLQNNNTVETTWIRDTMQGPAIIYAPNGTVLQRGQFVNNQFKQNQ